jgi:hypothetical protein
VRLVRHVGRLPPPSSRVVYGAPGGEFHTIVRFNPLGFRDPLTDFPARRRDTDRHILVLGDSYAAAWQVPLAERWTERMMAERPGWTTLNTGTPTWGTDREYLTFVHYPLAHEPDVVLLAMYPGNDVSDTGAAVLSRIPPKYPHFVPTGPEVNGFASLREVEWQYTPPAPPPGAAAWLRRHSVAWYGGRELIKIFSTASAPGTFPEAPPETQLQRVFDVFRQQNDDPAWRTAWQITEALLAQTKVEADRRDIRLAVVLVPYHGAIHPEMSPDLMRRDAGDFDLTLPYHRLTETARAQGIDLLDLTPGFVAFRDADPQQRELFLPEDKHLSSLGHCIAAALMATWLDPSLPPISTDRCR